MAKMLVAESFDTKVKFVWLYDVLAGVIRSLIVWVFLYNDSYQNLW